MAVGIFHYITPSRKGHSLEMACEDHAFPSRIESSEVGNTQRHSEGTRKELHTPQADALQCPPDNFLTRYT